MASKEYTLIREECTTDEAFTHYHNQDLGYSKRRRVVCGIVSIALTLVLAAFTLSIILHFLHSPCEIRLDKTAFASLERNKKIAWTDDNDFASHNRTTWAQAWATLNPDTGFVALGDDFAQRTGLHKSQRWPWDSSKGLYLLQGYHSLHCLVSYRLTALRDHHYLHRFLNIQLQTILRTSLTEMHDRKPQSLHFTHVNHCLDAFRQEIMCNADDTPRYSGLDQEMGTGNGQYRMCKDWGKLEEWAKEHSACYEYKRGVETLEGGIPLGRFKHCPDGSEPWKALSNGD